MMTSVGAHCDELMRYSMTDWALMTGLAVGELNEGMNNYRHKHSALLAGGGTLRVAVCSSILIRPAN
jgi:hypothetical protein